jgi:hypothetical protein
MRSSPKIEFHRLLRTTISPATNDVMEYRLAHTAEEFGNWAALITKYLISQKVGEPRLNVHSSASRADYQRWRQAFRLKHQDKLQVHPELATSYDHDYSTVNILQLVRRS